ncbi:hypothetical protein MLD38_018408 [Melastoma candidum]|uniref:Uncharacterized protein n=1 Tax=Melastoma candidum TaxID=119954 RepID=A0ACB9QSU7_9MYRT|nr:hypothetical protein MLD38_018408 [Melastoma candidum]
MPLLPTPLHPDIQPSSRVPFSHLFFRQLFRCRCPWHRTVPSQGQIPGFVESEGVQIHAKMSLKASYVSSRF